MYYLGAFTEGLFRSVKALIAKIEPFVDQYKHTSHPFAWTATADSILEKIRRLCQYISETEH